jgi:Fic family protein
MNRPPFGITDKILTQVSDICEKLGRVQGIQLLPKKLILRKENEIKTVFSSLAIEGNRLSENKVRTILEGKRVQGSKRDILEVKNALSVYKNIKSYDAFSFESLLKAHAQYMKGLVKDAGKMRDRGVAVYRENEVCHMAPPASQVPQLMENLFDFLKNSTSPMLIKACVFHYELEFIHPFSDGNGRMGRLWQQLILIRWNPLFEFVTVEAQIKENRDTYYRELRKADTLGESTGFIEFMLGMMVLSLDDLLENDSIQKHLTDDERLAWAEHTFGNTLFSRKDYRLLFKTLSTSTASRDLIKGVQSKRLKRRGEKNQSRYQFPKTLGGCP